MSVKTTSAAKHKWFIFSIVMLVSTMSFSEMKDECFKEAVHYMKVATAKHENRIFHNSGRGGAKYEEFFQTKRNNRCLVTSTLLPTLEFVCECAFYFFDDTGINIIIVYGDGGIYVFRTHVIKRVLQRLRFTVDVKALVRTFLKEFHSLVYRFDYVDDEIELGTENGIFYIKQIASDIFVAKTFIGKENLTKTKLKEYYRSIVEYNEHKVVKSRYLNEFDK